jgi:nitroimidazol reductase NimA-like FMN-containing flavoprotein (pyridoxamine 5'-phosphate oxidase superfamily)
VNQPRELNREQCLELLATGVVARVAVCTPDGPHIVPINYALHDDAVVFRTSPYSVLGTRGWMQRLALEIDQVDYGRRDGWSVVAAGMGEMVEDADDLATIQFLWDPRPWAGGSRPLYIRLRWDSLTGRKLGTGWSPSDEPPVRRRV